MGEVLAFDVNDFGHASNLAGRLGCGFGALAGDEHMHVTAALGGGGHGVEGGGLDARVVVFGNYQCCHFCSKKLLTSRGQGKFASQILVCPAMFQITFASFLSLSTSAATSATLTPALRLGGSLTLSVLMRGLTSTPRSSGLKLSICFFLAFMMLGSVT